MTDPQPPVPTFPLAGNPSPAAEPPAKRNPPPHRPRTPFFSCLFSLSLLLNLGAALALVILCASVLLRTGVDPDAPNVVLNEHYYSGSKVARDKIAIIRLDGVILEGLLSFPQRQIEQAARDDDVKAVVFRIDSPGGSITGSDDLHRRLVELRDGNPQKKTHAKPIVVSMGGIAASGGYYVAMPGKPILAERTTVTGSIGVYAAFPNVAKLANEHGIVMNTIRQGEIKDSGSPFREMNGKERQVWQDMVDHAYNQFLEVVVAGRPDHFNRDKLLEPVDITPVNAAPVRLKEPAAPYQRYRADGGIYTADMALKLNLIDKIGRLDDAVLLAEQAAGTSGDFRVIQYERPRSLTELLLGIKANKPTSVLDPAALRKGMTPRVWYLAPGCEFAGMLSAMEEN